MIIPRLRAPIVLVPGLFGFDEVKVAGLTLVSYFPGIPELLRSGGNHVLIHRPSPTEGVAQRAKELKDLIDREWPGEAVHLIAHSMGGLDARWMISRLGMAPRVLSLTTIATPHRGTVFADWGVRHLEWLVRPFFEFLTIPCQAFYDLTTAACLALNRQAPDAPGVRYFSVAGQCQPSWLTPQWHLPYFIVRNAEGPNDGVVSVASASYGESTEVWEGDHVSLVNWPSAPKNGNGSGDRLPHYVGLVRRLADEGF